MKSEYEVIGREFKVSYELTDVEIEFMESFGDSVSFEAAIGDLSDVWGLFNGGFIQFDREASMVSLTHLGRSMLESYQRNKYDSDEWVRNRLGNYFD